ncbi:LysM peptidoglycan-binding domain-containing protein, partial [Algibacter sp.]|nr:LysM peptidoglycan-binding domain-containing protein [Algibacter sp.]
HPSPSLSTRHRSIPPKPPGLSEVKYREFPLGEYAVKYDVRVFDLQAWNGMNDVKLRVGQQLLIYLSE